MARTPSAWANTPSSLPTATDSPWNSKAISPAPVWPHRARDLRSTSTVTESTASADSDRSSHDSTEDQSSTSTESPGTGQQRPALPWPIEEYDAHDYLLAPMSRKSLSEHVPSSRSTLPRCGVLNFRKEGDSLRWAPRVTQNCGGVAARVHNFEDAFSLEEFSSRALPVVWQARGGDPRLSVAAEDEKGKKSPKKMVKDDGDKKGATVGGTSEKHFVDRSCRSGFGSQKFLAKSPSFKRTIVIANEMRRPSFWSMLVHNNKYSKSKVKARLRSDDNEVATNNKVKESNTRGFKKSTWSAVLRAVTRKNPDEVQRGAGSAKKSDKKGSLFRRFVDKKQARGEESSLDAADTSRVEDRARKVSGSGERGGAIRMRRKNGDSRQSREVSRDGFLPGRRVRSCHGSPSKNDGTASIPSQDDQYVTFITSAV